MGCSGSRQANFSKINLWEPQNLKSENNSYLGSRAVKERVLFPEKHQGKSQRLEEICDRAGNEDQIMGQNKIEQCCENQKIEHSAYGDLWADGSLSEAIDLLDFSEISERNSSISLSDITEDAWDMPFRFKPGTNNSQRNALFSDIAKTNGQHNPNPWAYFTMMNRDFTYNYRSARAVIRHKSENTLQRRRTNHYDHISGYTCGPCKSSQNRWHAEISSKGRRDYQSINHTINSACKSIDNRILKYGKVSKEQEKYVTLLNDTVLEQGSSTDTSSCDQVETVSTHKISRPTEENLEYPENKLGAGLTTDSSVYLSRETLNTQKFMVAQLFLKTLQC